MNTGVRRHRRSIVCAVLAITVWLAVEALAPTGAAATALETSSVGTSAAQTGSEEGRRSNPGGAIAGFALLGGWLLLGGILFRQGRRRLARIADGPHSERQSDRETNPEETTTQHDRGSGPATPRGRSDEPSRSAGAG